MTTAKEALEFYADGRRYGGPNQRTVEGDKYAPEGAAYFHDVTRDNGQIARQALASLEGDPVERVARTDFVRRCKAYLEDAPLDGSHSDAAGSNAYELIEEAIEHCAATGLSEARAEIETKTQAIADMARQMYEMQSELSTLRARVREVVGGVLAHSCVADAGPDCKDEDDEAAERAARKLVEDLK